MNGKELKRFREYKKRIIVESTFDSTNILYGLTREHIEIVLGIPMPMLLESIDSHTRKKILYEQFLFEGVLANLAGGAKTFLKGKAKRLGNLPTNFDQLKEFLALVFEHPKWLSEFSGHLKDIVDNLASALTTYFKEIKESAAKTTKTKFSEAATKAIGAFEALFEKFSQLRGWSQAALGIGIASVGGFLFQKLKEVVPNIADTLKAGTQGAAVVAIDKPGPVTGSEVTGGSLAAIKIETVLHLLASIIGPKVISAIGSLATGGLHQALAFIATIVGGINNVINAIKPALSATMFFASRDPEQGQGIFTKGEDEPKQELEDFEQGLKRSASSPLGRLGSLFKESNNNNQLKLAVLLFEQKNKSSEKRTEKFINNVYDDVYPALYRQAKFVIDTMKSGKKPSNKDVVSHINHYMNRYQDINPIVSMDTYGVNMMINYLLKNSKDAGKAKRFYKSMIDAWLKNKV